MPTSKSVPSRPLRTPFKDLLPPLSSEEFNALRANIAANGVLNPVLTDEDDNVLDGHNRLEIDRDAPRRVIGGLSWEEKRAFVFASNMARRNLSPAQKKAALIAMKSVARALRAEQPKRNTQQRIAEQLGVSRNCVAKWFQRVATMHGTCPKPANVHSESAFLADARFTLPQSICCRHPSRSRRALDAPRRADALALLLHLNMPLDMLAIKF